MRIRYIALITLCFFAVSLMLWIFVLRDMKNSLFSSDFRLAGFVASTSEEQLYEQALIRSLEHYFAESYKEDALMIDVRS